MRQPDAISLRELQEPLLENGAGDQIDPQAEKELVKRLDRRLLAFAMLGNVVKALDNSSLASAFISGMEEELHITGIQYNWIGVFFIAGYLTMQVPSNVLLSRLRPSVYLPILELIWCILTLSMAFVQNVYQVYPIRLMLGLAEAGFYPGIVFLFGTWYSKTELGTRMALLNVSTALGVGLSGLIQAIMLKTLDGVLGVSGWRWMFVLNGCLTAMLAWFGKGYLPDYPQNTSWLTEKERNIVKHRTEASTERDKGSANWSSFVRLLKNQYIYLFLVGWTSLQIALGATHVLGIVAKRLGYDAVTSNLLTTPTTLLTMSANLLNGYLSDKTRSRFWCILPPAIMGLVGSCMLAGFVKPFGLLYAGFLINQMGIGSIAALVMTWASESMSQERGMRALAVSTLNTSASSMSLWTPLILWPVTDAPQYHTGFTASTICIVIFLITVSVIFYIQKQDVSLRARQDSLFDKDEML